MSGGPDPLYVRARIALLDAAASRVTLAVTHIGETECMHRPVPGARLLHRSQVPATGSSPERTLRHCNDVQERRDARRISESRIVCQHRRRSLSPVRVHDQHDLVGIACVDVTAARYGLQNEADG